MTRKTVKPKSSAGDKQAKAGRGGNIPPVEHRFKPGQSGNPAGYTKNIRNKRELEKLMLEILNEPLGETGMTRLEAMVKTMSSSRNPADKKTILEYAFGKVTQPVDVENSGEMRVIIEYADSDTTAETTSGATEHQDKQETV